MKTHYNAKVNLRELVSAQQKKKCSRNKTIGPKYDFRH